ncbi:MAG: suppressor of fused domain protein, partial [Vicinamibacteria bacterium]
PEPYAEGVRFCATLLTHPVSLGSEFAELTIRGRTIRFCQLMPLYPEELRFALRHTPKALLARFAQYQMSDVSDPERRNVCAFGPTELFERALGAACAKEASPASP